jgi:hypothetical protein
LLHGKHDYLEGWPLAGGTAFEECDAGCDLAEQVTDVRAVHPVGFAGQAECREPAGCRFPGCRLFGTGEERSGDLRQALGDDGGP